MTPTAPGNDDMTIEVKVPYPPCARCKVPTNDPDTGVLSPTNQPTKVMQVCRSGAALGMTNPKLRKHVFFGIHLALTFLGNANGDSGRVEVNCGGAVKALDRHTSLNSP